MIGTITLRKGYDLNCLDATSKGNQFRPSILVLPNENFLTKNLKINFAVFSKFFVSYISVHYFSSDWNESCCAKSTHTCSLVAIDKKYGL